MKLRHEDPDISPSEGPHPAWRILEILVLTSFALGQPMLALVGENPTFLVAHGLRGWEIAAFGAGVILVPAAALALIGYVTSRLHPAFGYWVHRSILGALLGLVIGPPLNRTLGLEGVVSVGSLILLAALATFTLARYRSLLTLIRYAAPAPAVFLALFIFNTSPATLPASGEASEGEIELDTRPPIVWMVFDQLPLPLLLDEQGDLLAERYPGFARLAEVSTWYPKAAAVAVNTHLAIPSILTGRYADPDRPPTAEAYPGNVFSLLAPDYVISARESVSRLCPTEICDESTPLRASVGPLLTDSGIIAARLLLVDNVADRFLPEINDRWANFGESGNEAPDASASRRVTGDDRWRFEEFLAELGTVDAPVLHYLHQEKPHEPLLMLPDGRIYDFCSCYYTDADGRWPDDTEMMNQRLQQYVLQTMYVDGQVSRMLDRMEDTGILAESVLIVVSDHGASIRPGQINRGTSASVSDDVFPVPMFIKLPGQVSGEVDNRRVSLIDIVPTVLDAFGADHLPDGFDGRSLLADTGKRPFRAVTTEGSIELDWPEASRSPLLDMANGLLPVPSDPYVFGDHGHMVGADVDNLLGGTSELTARVAVPGSEVTVDLGSDYAPARVIGELYGADSPTPLAVAFNGTVAGVGSTYYNDLWRISLMGDPEYLVDGDNDITLYEVAGDRLLRLPMTG